MPASPGGRYLQFFGIGLPAYGRFLVPCPMVGLSPELVERILGIRAFGMVAVDPNRKAEMMRILLDAVDKYVGQ